MIKPLIAGLCFGLAIAVLGVWVAQGKHSATLKEEMVEMTRISEDSDCAKDKSGEFPDDFDPEFCIETKRVPTEVFKIGLFDFVLPASGTLAGLGGLLVFLTIRRRES